MGVTLEELESIVAADENVSIDELETLVKADESTPEGDRLDAIIEPAIAIGGGIPATIAGGVAGAVQTLNPFADEGAGARAVRSTQALVQPETTAGQESLSDLLDIGGRVVDTLEGATKIPRMLLVGAAVEATGGDLGEALQTMADVDEKGLTDVLADKVLDVTNSPLAATAVKLSPDVAMAFLPASKLGSKSRLAKQKLINRIKRGDTDRALAPVMVKKTKIVPDKEAIQAIKQGFDDRFVQAVKQSSRNDKIKIKEMLDTFQRRKSDLLVNDRPIDVVGKSLMDRIKFIKQVNKRAGQDIDKIAKGLKGKPLDISSEVNQFGRALDDLGIKLVPDKAGVKADFTESILPPGDRGAINEVIRQMNRIGKKGIPDAQQAHELKRIIDNNVTFGKSQQGLSGDAENTLKSFRAGLDKALDTNFPSYNKANIDYAETINALNDIKSIVGKKSDLFGDNTHKLLGQLTRRLDSNAVSRPDLERSVAGLESLSLKHGAKFRDNIDLLVKSNKEFERMFGTVAGTSLKGDVGAIAEKAARNRGLGDVAVDVGKQGLEAIQGINEENAIKAITTVLSRP